MKFFKASALVALLGALSADAACPLGSPAAIGGHCVCPSGQTDTAVPGTCAAYTNNMCNAGSDGTPAATNPLAASTTLQAPLTVTKGTANDQKITVNLKIPMTQSRFFTGVWLTGLNAGETAPGTNCDSAAFTDFASAADAVGGKCVDSWTMRAKFTDLNRCGFVETADTTVKDANPTYQVFDGAIRIQYTEDVAMGAEGFANTVKRTVTANYPVRILLQSQYAVDMNVTDVKVFARQRIDYAIRAQVIPQSASVNPYADLTYTVQFPYAITGYTSTVAPSTTITGNTAITATATFGTPCAYADYGADRTISGASVVVADNNCMKTDTKIDFMPNREAASDAGCKFSGYEYTLTYAVQCYSDIVGTPSGSTNADCPLAAADSGTVTFKITSENFCRDTASDTIDGVIQVSSFKAVSDARGTQQNAWRWGDFLYMRMDFTGLLLNTVRLTKLESYYSTSDEPSATPLATTYTYVVKSESDKTKSVLGTAWTSGTPAAFYFKDGTDSWSNTAAPDNLGSGEPTSFGLVDVNDAGAITQYYQFATVVNEALTNGASPARGVPAFLKLKATIDVTYNRNARRRRQALSAGTAAKESDTQTISAPEPTEAAAAPNSAVRAAPAIALVLALLSAVALL